MIGISPVFEKQSFEDKKILKKLEEIFIQKRGYVFKLPPPQSSAILLLSGGFDSILLWFLLMKKYKIKVYPLYFVSHWPVFDPQWLSICFYASLFKKLFPDYYHPPRYFFDRSFFSFKKLYRFTSIANHPSLIFNNLVFIHPIKSYKTALINNPTRLFRFILAAYEYAHFLKFKNQIEVNTIFCGIVEDDTAILRESTLTVLRAINLSFCLILGDFSWQFSAALEKKAGFCFNKKQLMEFAIKNNIPLEKTWSCDRRLFFQCGTCPSCIGRREIFAENNILDKTLYWDKILPSPFRPKKIRSFFSNLFINKIKNKKDNNQKNRHLINQLSKNNLKNGNIKIASGVRLQLIKNNLYFVNKNTGAVGRLRLNPTALLIMEKIISHPEISVNHLIKLVSAKFKVRKTRVEKDLTQFIKKMIENRLLTLEKNLYHNLINLSLELFI